MMMPEGDLGVVPPLIWGASGEAPPMGAVVLAAEKGVGSGTPIAIANRGDVIPCNLVRYAQPSTLKPQNSGP